MGEDAEWDIDFDLLRCSRNGPQGAQTHIHALLLLCIKKTQVLKPHTKTIKHERSGNDPATTEQSLL